MKKLLTALLAAAVLLTAMTAAPVSAAPLKSDQTFGHIIENPEFYSQYEEAIDYAAQEIYNLHTDIDVARFRIPLDQRRLFYTTLMHSHPELFYVSRSYSVGYDTDENGNDYVTALFLHWGRVLYDANGREIIQNGRYAEETYSDEQVLQMRAEFRSRAQWYLDKVDDSMSDFDKALILHDELALNASYLITGETYDLMVNDVGKCYGYSECYSYLLAQVGVDTEIVGSDPMNHQWNKVKIDGSYYHVDLTWDDPLPDKIGYVNHTFFLLSDAAIEGYEANPHYSYSSGFPSANTRFDNKRFHKINTQMCLVGDSLYVVDNAYSGSTAGKLLTYDLSRDRFTTTEDFSAEKWYTSAGGSYWQSRYMSLQECDGYLYMNTQQTVYVYDTQTGGLSEFAQNTYAQGFYGLRVTDGKVYALLRVDPGAEGTLQYVGDCYVRPVPTTEPPTTVPPMTEPPTTVPPTTVPPTTEPPTTEPPTTEPPAAEDTYIIAGFPRAVFDTVWDGSNTDNQMEKCDDGAYEKTYTVSKGYNNIQFKIVKNGDTWIAAEDDMPITFHVTAAGSFTIMFDPEDMSIGIYGDHVSEKPTFLYSTVTVMGNGEDEWLNGIDWDPSSEKNQMHEVAEDVWEIEYTNVCDAFNRQLRFAIDGAEYDFFGGTFADSGAVTEAVYQGGNITFDTDDDSQTVKIQLDLRNFDYETKKGATFTVTIVPDAVMGDLDGDGEVTISDATFLLRCLTEFDELTEEQRAIADVSGDGRIDVRDVTAMQRIIAEIE